MHSARLSDYVKIREEVRNIMVTRMAINSTPSPMDISALGKGKDGKGKGGKGKDGKGKDAKGKGEKGKGKDGKGKDDDGLDDRICFYCQKKGHVKADCRRRLEDMKKTGGKGQEELAEEPPGLSGSQQELHGQQESVFWILSLSEDSDDDDSDVEHGSSGCDLSALDGVVESSMTILVDSGALASVCPIDNAPEAVTREVAQETKFRAANGAKGDHIGEKTVDYASGDATISIEHQVD